MGRRRQHPPTPTATTSVSTASDGRSYVGVAPLVGRTDGDTLAEVADLARELGGGRVRLTTQQKLVVLDVPDELVDEAVARLDKLALPAFPSQFHRGRWPAPA